MITSNIKWFLSLSVAAHAAVLVAWQPPALLPGKTGHALQVSVMQHSASSNVQSPPADQPARLVPESMTLPLRAETAVHRTVASSAAPRITRPLPLRKAEPAPSRETIQPDTASAATSTLAGNPVISRQETDQHLRSSVMELLTRELTYPAIARRKGWQGIVKLELHIEPDGSITGLQVDETSGYAVLDQAALQCLQLASLPDAARWLQGQAVDIVVPVEYRLVDS